VICSKTARSPASPPYQARIFPRTLDGKSLAEPLIVSIDLSEIAFP
jgi:hypothetical protein